MQASATLFDTVAGTFYGNTCRGKPVLPIEPTAGAEEVSVKGRSTTDTWDFELLDDVYFHSRIADPNCVVVVELSWVWRQDGVAIRSETAGWCTLPLSGDNIVPALVSTALFLGSAAAFAPAATQARTSALSAYVPQGLSASEYAAKKAADASKKQANKSRFPKGKNLVKDVADWLVEMEAKQTFKGDQVAGSGHTFAKQKFSSKSAFDKVFGTNKEMWE